MTEIFINFFYNTKEFRIKAKRNEFMKDIIKKFAKQVNINIKDICFIYKDKVIDLELKLEDINNIDKNINILAFELNNNINQENFGQIKDIICPKCGKNCLIKIENYKIIFNCCNNNN